MWVRWSPFSVFPDDFKGRTYEAFWQKLWKKWHRWHQDEETVKYSEGQCQCDFDKLDKWYKKMKDGKDQSDWFLKQEPQTPRTEWRFESTGTKQESLTTANEVA